MESFTRKMLLTALIVLLISPFANAAVKYGEMTIRKGNVIVVRNHRMRLYTQKNNPVVLYENDTVRTLKGSALSLTNPDQNRVYLGANSIMQLKKWKQKKSSGTIRMLFGKFRARTTKFRKNRSLNIRTATATMGIKGSLLDGNTGPDFTSGQNLGGDISIINNAGEEYDISEGQMGFLVDSLDQTVNFELLPGFVPGQTEDQREGANLGALDNDASKKAEVPESIRQAIKEKIVETAAKEGKTLSKEELERATPDTREELTEYIQNAIDNAAGTGVKVNVNVSVED